MNANNGKILLFFVFLSTTISADILSFEEYLDDTVYATSAPPSSSVLGVYPSAAISSDGVPCAQIGTDVLRTNGSVIDAALASLFCVGVVNAQSMGLGGGFFMTYYQRSTQTAYVLDSREIAPGAATEDMYEDAGELAEQGGLAVAVPGEIRGYREVYDRFGGTVPWADLIEPTARLCEVGNPVNSHMANALLVSQNTIKNEPSMSVFIDPSTGNVYKEGDNLTRPDLARTLRVLQQEPDALHNGSLTDVFLQDLQQLQSIITREDLENYRPVWRTPVSIDLSYGNLKMYSMPPPGSGVILGFILNVLENYMFTDQDLNDNVTVTTHQRIVETFKYAYARRTELGDEDFVDMVGFISNLTSDAYAADIFSRITDNVTFQEPEYYGAVTFTTDDRGTAQLSVAAPNGDAVSVTSTVNFYFGAKIRSVSTGIVLNNEMADFSFPNQTSSFGLPPSPSNFIVPGKRPMSSMCPAIFVDQNGDVRQVIGAAGGTQISSATAWVSLKNLWFGYDIKEAIDDRRLHHQLYPMNLGYENMFRQDIIDGLQDIGHETNQFASQGSSVVCAVTRENDVTYANADWRKGGEVDGF